MSKSDHEEAAAHPFFRPVSSLSREPKRTDGARTRLVHCINPFAAPPKSEHEMAQTITLQAMENAKIFAQGVSHNLDVALHAACFQEDIDALDLSGFDHVSTLQRSILDFLEPEVPRKFPLLFDILSSVGEGEGDFFIFTNTDIAPLPHFYVFIHDLLMRGFDAIIINRRTVSESFDSPADIPLAYSDMGRPHEGCDCFIISRQLLETLPEHRSCIGISFVTMPLTLHMIANAVKPVFISDGHLTFHVGDDKSWNDPRFEDYTTFNRSESKRIRTALEASPERRDNLTSRLSDIPEGVLVHPGLSNYITPPQTASNSPRGLALARALKRRLSKFF